MTSGREFQELVDKLEPAYKEAFGATPLNWSCFMNHSFRSDPPNPHVYWHLSPRYKVAPVLDGISYDDPSYGEFYNDDDAKRIVSNEVIEQIAEKLKGAMATR